jgi:hypothetical protein
VVKKQRTNGSNEPAKPTNNKVTRITGLRLDGSIKIKAQWIDLDISKVDISV